MRRLASQTRRRAFWIDATCVYTTHGWKRALSRVSMRGRPDWPRFVVAALAARRMGSRIATDLAVGGIEGPARRVAVPLPGYAKWGKPGLAQVRSGGFSRSHQAARSSTGDRPVRSGCGAGHPRCRARGGPGTLPPLPRPGLLGERIRGAPRTAMWEWCGRPRCGVGVRRRQGGGAELDAVGAGFAGPVAVQGLAACE